MDKKYQKYLSAAILSFGLIFSAIMIGDAFAQTDSETGHLATIQYPVAELGNCRNESECRAYCDELSNREVCFEFARKNNLMSQEEVEIAEKFLAGGGKGPGGCSSKDSCENYCNDVSHLDECVAFAEKSGIMPKKELEQAQKIRAAIKKGVKMPPCNNKKQCDAYCSNPDHIEECVAFAEAAGFMDERELQESKKFLQAVKKGIKPPLCRGKEECDVYCSNPDHIEECVAFAEAAGFMDEREKQESKKFIEAIKKGVKPPQCRGREECDAYCAEENHIEECMKFAEAAGFMTSEEIEMARKTGGKGPGGCRGKEQCEAFCGSPENQEKCFNFAKEHGFIKQEDIQKMEEGKQQFIQMLNQAAPGVVECLNSLIGIELMEKIKSGAAMPSHDIGEKVRECVEKTMGAQGMGPGMGVGGPGQPGLPSFELMSQEVKECLRATLGEDAVGRLQSGVMKDDEKNEFMQKAGSCFEQIKIQREGENQGGFIQQGFGDSNLQNFQGGPGGCKTPEECKIYCESHQEECKNPGLQQMQAPRQNMMAPKVQGFENLSPEVIECLKLTAGENIAEQLQSGALQAGQEIGEKIKACFEKTAPLMPSPADVFKPIMNGINPVLPTEGQQFFQYQNLTPEQRQIMQQQTQQYPGYQPSLDQQKIMEQYQQQPYPGTMPVREPIFQPVIETAPIQQEPQSQTFQDSVSGKVINFFRSLFDF